MYCFPFENDYPTLSHTPVDGDENFLSTAILSHNQITICCRERPWVSPRKWTKSKMWRKDTHSEPKKIDQLCNDKTWLLRNSSQLSTFLSERWVRRVPDRPQNLYSEPQNNKTRRIDWKRWRINILGVQERVGYNKSVDNRVATMVSRKLPMHSFADWYK